VSHNEEHQDEERALNEVRRRKGGSTKELAQPFAAPRGRG
jgi:hypothetical protein